MNHATLTTLRDRHPAWRLLASPHAPLVASFLHRVFVLPNVRVMSEADVAEALRTNFLPCASNSAPTPTPRARELLADFREVDHNFRQLDRKVRKKIWIRCWRCPPLPR